MDPNDAIARSGAAAARDATVAAAAGDGPRIALIRQRYNPYGGAERFVSTALQALRGQGAQLTLVTRRWTDASAGDSIVCDPFYIGSLWRDWGFARAACRRLAAGGFDIVQSHERIACCDIYRAGDGVHREWLAQRARVAGPMKRLSLALNPYHAYVRSAERRVFTHPRLKAVICISAMVRDEVVKYFGVAPDKLHVIHPSVDLDRFHPRLKAEHRAAWRDAQRIPAQAPLFVYVGSGFERKGVGPLLRAFRQLPASSHLAVVGRDKHAARFQALARELGVADRVRFTGPLDDVRPCYGAADAFVLPTLYDPFSVAVMEALACGLPVVASTKCGGAELVEEDRNGYVRDALDVTGLAQAMTHLLQPARCERFGAVSRARVEPLTLAAMVDRLLELYAAVMPPRPRGA